MRVKAIDASLPGIQVYSHDRRRTALEGRKVEDMSAVTREHGIGDGPAND